MTARELIEKEIVFEDIDRRLKSSPFVITKLECKRLMEQYAEMQVKNMKRETIFTYTTNLIKQCYLYFVSKNIEPYEPMTILVNNCMRCNKRLKTPAKMYVGETLICKECSN